MQCPSKRVCGNAQSGYGMNTPGPGYMENTQSFKAKQQEPDIASKYRGSGESLPQQQQHRYSCSSYMIL
ncbi:hypothetical protein YC2023_076579 [Brassica napus]